MYLFAVYYYNMVSHHVVSYHHSISANNTESPPFVAQCLQLERIHAAQKINRSIRQTNPGKISLSLFLSLLHAWIWNAVTLLCGQLYFMMILFITCTLYIMTKYHNDKVSSCNCNNNGMIIIQFVRMEFHYLIMNVMVILCQYMYIW